MTSISRGGDYRTSNPTSVGEPEKVTAWPFKDPEKKSYWGDDADKPKFELRDEEREKTEKRSAMIKARMSPPGALRLPELLDAERLLRGIPDGFFRSQACFDRIYVFPIDQFDDMTTYSVASPILRPNLTKLKDMQEGHRGVLLSAGLTAADRLMSHGIELGHIVTTNKNVPFARRCERLEDGTEMFYLIMRDGDLAGSETLAHQLRNDARRVVDIGGDGEYQHQIARCDDGTWSVDKKKSVYIADSW